MEKIKNKEIVKKFDTLVSKYNDTTLLRLILDKYFKEKNYEELINLMSFDNGYGKYTWEKIKVSEEEAIFIREVDVLKDSPNDTYDNVGDIVEQMLDEGIKRELILITLY